MFRKTSLWFQLKVMLKPVHCRNPTYILVSIPLPRPWGVMDVMAVGYAGKLALQGVEWYQS